MFWYRAITIHFWCAGRPQITILYQPNVRQGETERIKEEKRMPLTLNNSHSAVVEEEAINIYGWEVKGGREGEREGRLIVHSIHRATREI